MENKNLYKTMIKTNGKWFNGYYCDLCHCVFYIHIFNMKKYTHLPLEKVNKNICPICNKEKHILHILDKYWQPIKEVENGKL